MVAFYIQNSKIMVKKYLLVLLFVVYTTYAFADFWEDAKITITYSQNKEYMLVVYPIKYPNIFITPKHHRLHKNRTPKDTIIPCHAVLYKLLGTDTVEVWNKLLVNNVSPVEIIVANDGKSVVTFDDWHSRGFQHTMVVYLEYGDLFKDFSLKEISPFPLEQYYRTISSIHWGSHGKYIDNNRVEVSFHDEKGETRKRVFNIKQGEFE